MDNLIKKGQIVTTALKARGVVTWLSNQQVAIKWTITDGGKAVDDPNDNLVKYPMADIQHSINGGFLKFSDSDDPNVAFLSRKLYE